MRVPKSELLEYFVTTIKDYDAKIDVLAANTDVLDDNDAVGEMMIDARKALITMNVAWKHLTGINLEFPNSDIAKAKLQTYLEEYTGETNTKLDDFVYRLKDEPDSMETLAEQIGSNKVEITPKLLSDTIHRLKDYGLDLTAGEAREITESFIGLEDGDVEVFTRIMLKRTLLHIMKNAEKEETT